MMSSRVHVLGLTTKQKEELNIAIHEYLVKHKYN